jgi:hypothetical protein
MCVTIMRVKRVVEVDQTNMEQPGYFKVETQTSQS